MHFRHQLVALLALAALSPAIPGQRAEAQRRPGMNMGFYTTTGLLTGDIEAGSVNSTTELTESPSIAAAALLTGALMKRPRRAWIIGVRGPLLSLGNSDRCVVTLGAQGCQSRRFTERGSILTGGAFDIRATIFRAMVGPALYQVEGSGVRVGTQVRLDLAAPRLRGPTPTVFVTRSMLGSQGGQGVGITTLGAGLRWVRRR